MEFWSTLQLVSTVIVGGCFLLSGFTKLREPAGTSETFSALGVPAVFDRTWIHRAYPWCELLVGVGVLLAPVYAWWLFSLSATLLLAALSWFVWRVIASDSAVECNCFGSHQPVTTRTLARNLIFLGFALTLLLTSPAAPAPLLSAAPEQLPLLFGVLVTAIAATVLTSLSQGGSFAPTDAEIFEDRELTLPDLEVLNGDGEPVRLLQLVAQAPMLLVSVKEGCGACDETKAMFEGVEMIAGRVRVQLLERTPPNGPDASRAHLWDDQGQVAQSLGLNATPSAILIAANGSIPADPVYGTKQIRELIEGIEEAVAQTTPPPTSEIIS